MIEQLKQQLADALASYRTTCHEAERVWRPFSNQVKALQAQITAAIAEGANHCAICDLPATGLEFEALDETRQRVTLYEIGCSGSCRHYRDLAERMKYARRAPEEAVRVWNVRNPGVVS